MEQPSVRDLLVNLLASLIWAIAGVVAYRFVFLPVMRARTALSRLLPFDLRGKICICYGLLPPRPGTVYYTVAEGDLAAINTADSTLAGTYGRSRVQTMSFYSTEVRLGEIDNLLSISGPKWNRVTEVLLGRLGSPMTFNQTDGLVVQRPGSAPVEYHAVRRPDGDEQTCYGFVCGGVVLTPTGKEQNVVVCAGLNTLSTYGVVVFLTALREQYSFRRYPGLSPRRIGKRWGIIIRVESVSNPNTSGPVRRPVDPDHIAIEVIDVLAEDDFSQPFVYRF
ncbi:hypothetical protein AB0D78_27950 [Streptomyces avermitilis]|uniref:hypothetical protein n=1 Tax=Streptomyces avermitilis TaxID=33903 RepID=UPI0033FECC7E